MRQWGVGSASTAMLRFVRHLKTCLTFHNVWTYACFAVTYNLQIFCCVLCYDKTRKCRYLGGYSL